MKRPALLFFSLFACGKSSAPPTAATVDVTAGPPSAASAHSTPEEKQFDFVIDEKPNGEWAGAHGNVPVTPTSIYVQDGLVLVAGPGKILRSTDHGRHWTVREGPQGEPSIAATANGVFVAGKDVFHSKDRGRHWTKLPSPPGSVRGLSAGSWDALWAVMDNVDTPSFIAKSSDNGVSWSEVKNKITVTELYSVIPARADHGLIFAGKAPTPGGGSRAILLQTEDDGSMSTFVHALPAPAYPGSPHDASRRVCFTSSGAMFATTSYGVHASLGGRGQGWILSTDVGTEVLSLACAGKWVVAGGRNRQVRITEDEGAWWKANETDAVIGQPLVAITAAWVSPHGDVILGAESYAKSGGGTLLVRRRSAD